MTAHDYPRCKRAGGLKRALHAKSNARVTDCFAVVFGIEAEVVAAEEVAVVDDVVMDMAGGAPSFSPLGLPA